MNGFCCCLCTDKERLAPECNHNHSGEIIYASVALVEDTIESGLDHNDVLLCPEFPDYYI